MLKKKMTTTRMIRMLIISSFTLFIMLLGGLTPMFPIYLDVIDALSTPLLLLFGGYFSVDCI